MIRSELNFNIHQPTPSIKKEIVLPAGSWVAARQPNLPHLSC